MAVDVVEQMVQGELVPSTETINSILHACEESYEFNLVCGLDIFFFQLLVYYLVFGISTSDFKMIDCISNVLTCF